VGSKRSARRLAESGNDVDNAVGYAGLGDQLGQSQRGERGLLGRLQNNSAAGCQRRAELPGSHQQREVPRDDLPDDADRLAERVGVEVRSRHVRDGDVDGVALDLGRPPGHVVEQVRGKGHIGGLRDKEWLAVVERLQLSQLVDVLQDQVAYLPHDAPALGWRHPAPGSFLER